MMNKLYWFFNNLLRWLTQMLAAPIVILIEVTRFSLQPFLWEFRTGAVELSWGWVCIKDQINYSFELDKNR